MRRRTYNSLNTNILINLELDIPLNENIEEVFQPYHSALDTEGVTYLVIQGRDLYNAKAALISTMYYRSIVANTSVIISKFFIQFVTDISTASVFTSYEFPQIATVCIYNTQQTYEIDLLWNYQQIIILDNTHLIIHTTSDTLLRPIVYYKDPTSNANTMTRLNLLVFETTTKKFYLGNGLHGYLNRNRTNLSYIDDIIGILGNDYIVLYSKEESGIGVYKTTRAFSSFTKLNTDYMWIYSGMYVSNLGSYNSKHIPTTTSGKAIIRDYNGNNRITNDLQTSLAVDNDKIEGTAGNYFFKLIAEGYNYNIYKSSDGITYTKLGGRLFLSGSAYPLPINSFKDSYCYLPLDTMYHNYTSGFKISDSSIVGQTKYVPIFYYNGVYYCWHDNILNLEFELYKITDLGNELPQGIISLSSQIYSKNPTYTESVTISTKNKFLTCYKDNFYIFCEKSSIFYIQDNGQLTISLNNVISTPNTTLIAIVSCEDILYALDGNGKVWWKQDINDSWTYSTINVSSAIGLKALNRSDGSLYLFVYKSNVTYTYITRFSNKLVTLDNTYNGMFNDIILYNCNGLSLSNGNITSDILYPLGTYNSYLYVYKDSLWYKVNNITANIKNMSVANHANLPSNTKLLGVGTNYIRYNGSTLTTYTPSFSGDTFSFDSSKYSNLVKLGNAVVGVNGSKVISSSGDFSTIKVNNESTTSFTQLTSNLKDTAYAILNNSKLYKITV